MKMTALSVRATTFVDKQTGIAKEMWQVFCSDDTGAVGSVYSTEAVKTGDSIDLKIAVNRDGKFAVKIARPQADGKFSNRV